MDPSIDQSNLNQTQEAFRHLSFQAIPNECDNTSFTDLTGTTNTAADTSIENNAHNMGYSKY